MPTRPSNLDAADPVLLNELGKRGRRVADRGLFFRKFLAKGRTISSAAPSSKALVAGVLREVDFSRPSVIVELGAGIGPVTEAILDRISPAHRFVAVENDPDFCDVLRRRFPDMSLLQTDATRVGDPLANLGITKVDYVISGLPTPALPRRGLVNLSRWLRASLAPTGRFVQITVAPLVYRSFYERLFEDVSYRMIWWNFPPGGVYRCSRPRPAGPVR